MHAVNFTCDSRGGRSSECASAYRFRSQTNAVSGACDSRIRDRMNPRVCLVVGWRSDESTLQPVNGDNAAVSESDPKGESRRELARLPVPAKSCLVMDGPRGGRCGADSHNVWGQAGSEIYPWNTMSSGEAARWSSIPSESAGTSGSIMTKSPGLARYCVHRVHCVQ